MDSQRQIIEFQNQRIIALTEALRQSEQKCAELHEKLNPVRVVSIIDIKSPVFDKPYNERFNGISKSS